jgi:drug/metabolite transporter (DMT)-like permease
MGIALAILALFSWGVGGFLVQKSARKFGDWLSLFYICAIGVILVSPFVYHEIFKLTIKDIIFLLFVSMVILFAALFDFEAYKKGKLVVVESINSFELPIAALLASLILGETLSFRQWSLIVVLFVGIFLISTKDFSHFRKSRLEKGVWLAGLATIGMGMTDFLFGVGGRETSPLMINWFTDVVLTFVCFGYLFYKSRLKEIIPDFKANKSLILGVSLFDNAAWIAYTYSMSYIPIAIATGLSEGYIVLSSCLGLFINKERLKIHQLFGLAVCVVAAIALAYTVEV